MSKTGAFRAIFQSGTLTRRRDRCLSDGVRTRLRDSNLNVRCRFVIAAPQCRRNIGPRGARHDCSPSRDVCSCVTHLQKNFRGPNLRPISPQFSRVPALDRSDFRRLQGVMTSCARHLNFAWPSSASATLACLSPSNSPRRGRCSASTSTNAASPSLRAGDDVTRELTRGRAGRGQDCCAFRPSPADHRRLQLLHRHRADAGRRRQAARSRRRARGLARPSARC